MCEGTGSEQISLARVSEKIAFEAYAILPVMLFKPLEQSFGGVKAIC
uniref:Uncharacterized protein n=2 Tax=Candidatus Kentrum eta TaxID=2126337 RepID=A0A450W4W0_9GAMM|nr:MAG: hypothetical protein BECKH772C_GA0070978_109131 [Candidatus Kentron sp. H]